MALMEDLFALTARPAVGEAPTRQAGERERILVFDIVVQGIREAAWRDLFEGFRSLKAITFSASVPAILEVVELFDDIEITFGSERVLSRELAALEQATTAAGYRFTDALADQKVLIERFVRPALSKSGAAARPCSGRKPALPHAPQGAEPCQAVSAGRRRPVPRRRRLGQPQPRGVIGPAAGDLFRRRR